MSECIEAANDDQSDKYSLDSLDGATNVETRLRPLIADEISPLCSDMPFRLHQASSAERYLNSIGFRWPLKGDGLVRSELSKDTKKSTASFKQMWNCDIDESVLSSKGLQLNRDGSFSKSPREELPNLPFVLPAIKVEEYRRKKLNTPKRCLRDKIGRSLNRGFKPKEVDTLQDIINGVSPNVSGDMKFNQNPNYMELREIERMKSGGNLTDSMKEALYKNFGRKKEKAAAKSADSPKASKSNNSTDKVGKKEKSRTKQCSEKNQLQQKLHVLPLLVKEMTNNAVKKNKQKSEEFIRPNRIAKKNKSEYLLPQIEKPKLSYFERYQKGNGFDPLSVGTNKLKPPNDSVRSNFGDSSPSSLSDVSPKLLTPKDDPSEELFYENIIRKEKIKLAKNPSDFSSGKKSLKSETSSKSADKTKEVITKKTSQNKNVNLSVKMKTSSSVYNPVYLPSNTSTSGKKSQRLAWIDPTSLPKAELVSKAKAYGNLANTRNIVRLKMQSQVRDIIPIMRGKERRAAAAAAAAIATKNAGSEQIAQPWDSPKKRPARVDKSNENSCKPPFLPTVQRVTASLDESQLQLPWETRNLLMQISVEKEMFQKTISKLKKQMNELQKCA